MSWWTGSPGASSLWTSPRPRRRLRSSPARRRAGGFTLLEVIVAFTILSVSLVALLQAFATGMQGLGAAKTSAAALMHARSMLDEVGQSIELEDGESSGAFEDGYTWRLRIAEVPFEAPYEDGDQAVGPLVIPFEVEVEVAAPQGRGVTLTTLRLGVPE